MSSRYIQRLSDEELFHFVPAAEGGIAPIGDDTLIRRLDEAERRALRDAAPAYPDLLKHPELM